MGKRPAHNKLSQTFDDYFIEFKNEFYTNLVVQGALEGTLLSSNVAAVKCAFKS